MKRSLMGQGLDLDRRDDAQDYGEQKKADAPFDMNAHFSAR